MMNTKINTKTWTDKPTEPIKKVDTASNMSPQQMEEVLGGKDIGTFLNEMTDKNYVDPSKMRKPQGKMDKDAFLKLMLTQLKYQDPMNPLESHEMAAQLAQFSQLEQLQNVNDNIQGLTKAQNPMSNYQALNFIGKSVAADTEKIIRSKGDTSHDLRFTLPDEAKSVEVSVLDETGQVVKTLNAYSMKKGENKVTWSGTKEDGYPAYAGNYTFRVEGEALNGQKIQGKTSFSGIVTGLNYSPEGPILMIGDQKVKLSDVKNIEDQAQRFAQDMRDNKGQAVQSAEQKPDGEEPQGAVERPTGNIDFIPMSGELKDRLVKETT